MKLLHLADLHIGKSLAEYNLTDDQEYIFTEILSIAREESVDAVLIAGDVYDKSVPSEEAVKLFDRLLRMFASEKIAVYIISGNHDSEQRLRFGGELFKENEIYIAAGYDKEIPSYKREDELGSVRIWLLPFVKASRVKRYFPEEKIETYEDALRVILEHADIHDEERNVLIAHQFVTGGGGESPRLSGSEGMAVQTVGTVEMVSAKIFDRFDYVALGHIHSPQAVGSERIRYAGSPLKYSLSEAGHLKSVPIITLGEKGKIDVKLKELIPKRDLRHLTGKLGDLLQKDNIVDEEDYIYITLTDEDPVANAIGIIRGFYPNTVKVDISNSYTQSDVDFTPVSAGKQPRELMRDFYKAIYGCEMNEEEEKELFSAAGEAGVIHETD